MNIWILIVGISLVMLLIFSTWKYILSKNKLLTISDELKFFKKEKEYYEEAMLLLSPDYTIVYANQSAKNLFSLNDENEIIGVGKNIQLEIKQEFVCLKT